MARGSFVSYLRVSTDRQGRSGLGIAAQRQAVEDYLNGGRWKLVAEFVEVESGTEGRETEAPGRSDRLQGQRRDARDRETRPAGPQRRLRLEPDGERGRLRRLDFPQANRLTVHILAAVAEHEAAAISDPHQGSARGGQGEGREARRRPRARGALQGRQDDLQGYAKARAGASGGGSPGAQGGVAQARAGAGSDYRRAALAGDHRPAPPRPCARGAGVS